MTAPEWVYGSGTSLCEADNSFHAGLATDLIYGNLKRSYEMSRISYQSAGGVTNINAGDGYPTDALYYYRDYTDWSTDTLYGLSEVGAWPFPMRASVSGDFRPVTIRLKGRLIGVSGQSLTVRVYLLNQAKNFGWQCPPTENDAWGSLYYSTVTFTTTTWAWQSCTISSVPMGQSIVPINSSVPIYTYPMGWFHFAGSCTSSCSTALAAPHFLEVTST